MHAVNQVPLQPTFMDGEKAGGFPGLPRYVREGDSADGGACLEGDFGGMTVDFVGATDGNDANSRLLLGTAAEDWGPSLFP